MVLIAGSMPYKFTIFFYFKSLLLIMQERVASWISPFLPTPLFCSYRIVPDHAVQVYYVRYLLPFSFNHFLLI